MCKKCQTTKIGTRLLPHLVNIFRPNQVALFAFLKDLILERWKELALFQLKFYIKEIFILLKLNERAPLAPIRSCDWIQFTFYNLFEEFLFNIVILQDYTPAATRPTFNSSQYIWREVKTRQFMNCQTSLPIVRHHMTTRSQGFDLGTEDNCVL